MSQYGFNLLEPIHPVDNHAFFTAHSDPEEVYGNKNPEKNEKDNRNLRRRVENQAAAILHLPDPTLQTHLSDVHIRDRTAPIIGSPITPDLEKTLTRVADKCGRIAEQTGIKIDCSEDNDQQMQNDFSSSIDQEETPISHSNSSSSSSFHLNPDSEAMEVGDPEDRFLFSLLERQSSGSIDSSEMWDSAHLVRSSSPLPFEDRSSSQSPLPLRTDALKFSNHTSYTDLSIDNIQAVAHCLMQEELQGGVQVTDQQIKDCCRQNGLQVNAAYVKELLPEARKNRGFYVFYCEDVTNAHPKPAPPPKEPTLPKTNRCVLENKPIDSDKKQTTATLSPLKRAKIPIEKTKSRSQETRLIDLQTAFAAHHNKQSSRQAAKTVSLSPSTFWYYKTAIKRCLEEEKKKNRELSLDEISECCRWGNQQKAKSDFVKELLPEARKYMTAIYEPLFERTHSSSSSSTHSHSSLLSEIPQYYLNNLVHTGRAPESIATHESVLSADAEKKRIKHQPRTTVANLQKAFDAIHHGQNVKDAAKTTWISYFDFSRYIAAVANCLKQEKDQGAQLTNEQLQQCCQWNDLIQVDLDFVKELLPEARKYKETIYIPSLEDLHRNNLKNQEFDGQALQNSDLEQVDIVQGQDASKNQNFEKEPINTEEYISAALEYLCNKKQLKNLSIEKVATNKNLKCSKLKYFIDNAKLVLQNKPCNRYPQEVAVIVTKCREIAQKRKISIEQLIGKRGRGNKAKTSLEGLQTAFGALHNNQTLTQAPQNTILTVDILWKYKKAVARCLQKEQEKNRELTLAQIKECCRWGKSNPQQADPDFVKELLPEARKYMHIYKPSFTRMATSTSSVQNAPEVNEESQNTSKKRKFDKETS